MKLPFGKYGLIIVIVCIVSRIPLLLSDNMVLDLDECVIGLMAKHQYEGKGFSLFFWGQSYGFSLPETTAIAISYAIGGISDNAVKIPMLLFWIIGIIYFYKALLEISTDRRTAFLLTLLLALSPAWALWSLKARGGYLTAFTLSSIVLFLLVRKKQEVRNVHYLFLGILLAIIYEAQPIWLPGLTPFVSYHLIRQKKWKYAAFMLAGCTTVLFLFFIAKQDLFDYHHPPILEIGKAIGNIDRIPKYLFYNLHGMYFFDLLYKPFLIMAGFAVVFSALIYLLIARGVYILFLKEKPAFFLCTVLSVALTLLYSIFSGRMEPRYLLPVTGYALIALQLFLNERRTRKVYHAILSLLIAWGAIAAFTLKDFAFCKTKEKELTATINYLLERDIHHVYTPDWQLYWQVMFYSKEKILAREYESRRRPEYITAIDRALYNGKKVAIIGFENEYNGIAFPIQPTQLKGYYIYENPGEELLSRHFQLSPK
jgi:hypothetical protein